jgi:hypothetical protein
MKASVPKFSRNGTGAERNGHRSWRLWKGSEPREGVKEEKASAKET